MANKSISMNQIRRIIQLKAEKYSKLKISELLHIHRATLEGYLSKIEQTEQSCTELLEYNDEQLRAKLYKPHNEQKADSRLKGLLKHFDYFKSELKIGRAHV